jgi:hypothetical protein
MSRWKLKLKLEKSLILFNTIINLNKFIEKFKHESTAISSRQNSF